MGKDGGELAAVFAKLFVVMRGGKELRFERNQKRTVQPRGPEKTFQAALASTELRTQSNKGNKCVSSHCSG